ncbi:MAG: hypothetical protein WB608_08490 [Terracidiphilus sp.]
MRFANKLLSLTLVCLPCLICTAQSPANETSSQAAPAVQSTPALPVQSASAPPVSPSGLMQPALDTVQHTLGNINLEKWKRGNIREEAGDNIGKILKDLKETLPPLLNDADAGPGAISKALPVARNVGAVYDVLLRVVEAARVSAPSEQISALQKALISLGNARHAFDVRMQGEATTLEKQVTDLQATVQKQANFKCPATPAPVVKPCVPPAPHPKAKKKPTPPAAKTPPKPATPATTTPKTGP